MDFDFLKIRNLLAVAAALGAEFLIAHLTDTPAFSGPTGTAKYGAFLVFLVFFLILFWGIDKLVRWAARR